MIVWLLLLWKHLTLTCGHLLPLQFCWYLTVAVISFNIQYAPVLTCLTDISNWFKDHHHKVKPNACHFSNLTIWFSSSCWLCWALGALQQFMSRSRFEGLSVLSKNSSPASLQLNPSRWSMLKWTAQLGLKTQFFWKDQNIDTINLFNGTTLLLKLVAIIRQEDWMIALGSVCVTICTTYSSFCVNYYFLVQLTYSDSLVCHFKYK